MVAFGMPVGPFTLLDTVGLDIALEVARILHRSYGPRMAPAPLLEALVKAGRWGVKSGHGFYDYSGAEERRGEQNLDTLLRQVRQGGKYRKMEWTRARPLLAMVNEAVTALQEGVASARDIDVAMVAGTGFPNEKGGPLPRKSNWKTRSRTWARKWSAKSPARRATPRATAPPPPRCSPRPSTVKVASS